MPGEKAEQLPINELCCAMAENAAVRESAHPVPEVFDSPLSLLKVVHSISLQ